MEDLFSPYAASSMGHSQLHVFFGTPDPSSTAYTREWKFSLFQSRSGGTSLGDMMKGLATLNSRKTSHHLRRQLAIVSVILWIHSFQGLPDADKGYNILPDQSSTLDFAAVYSNADLPKQEITGYGQKEIEGYKKTIILGIDQLTAAELGNLVKTIKSFITRTENQPHRDKALRSLVVEILPRSHVPNLMEEDIFEVLADKERSSLHRDFFNRGTELPLRGSHN